MILAFLVLVVASVPTPLSAQSRPSFAGQWVQVDTAPERTTVARTGDARFRVGDMGSGWDSPLTIRQSSDSLIVEFQHFAAYDLQPKLHFAFALDGSETFNRITIGHAESDQRARVRWDGATLVITTLFPTPPEVGATPTQVRQTLSLDAAGRMVMETTRPGASGPNIVRTVFEKR